MTYFDPSSRPSPKTATVLFLLVAALGFAALLPHPALAQQASNMQITSRPWPLAWRGNLTDDNLCDEFPNFGSTQCTNSQPVTCGQACGCSTDLQSEGGSGGAYFCGLSSAQQGDIIYWTIRDSQCLACQYTQANSTSKPMTPMPFAGIVTGTFITGTDSDYVQVVIAGYGKYPDVMGNGDSQGFGQTVRIMKNSLPGNVTGTLYPAGTVVNGNVTQNAAGNGLLMNDYGNCADSRLSTCTFAYGPSGTVNQWDNIRVYRPTQDVRNTSGLTATPTR